MLRRISLLLLTVGIISQTARAEDKAGAGFGTSTCTQFANLYKFDAQYTEQQYFNWTQGFLTGFNYAQMHHDKSYLDLNSMDTKAQEASIRRYCDQHPLGLYIDAVINLANELQMKRLGQ